MSSLDLMADGSWMYRPSRIVGTRGGEGLFMRPDGRVSLARVFGVDIVNHVAIYDVTSQLNIVILNYVRFLGSWPV